MSSGKRIEDYDWKQTGARNKELEDIMKTELEKNRNMNDFERELAQAPSLFINLEDPAVIKWAQEYEHAGWVLYTGGEKNECV